jgi:hypothetical protein
MTCHLKKSLYGLKQSGRNWHITLTDYLKSEGFIANSSDPCTFSKTTETDSDIILIFWVDDIVIACSDEKIMNETKRKLSEKFKIDDRGELNWFRGIDFTRLPDGSYKMSQARYARSVLKRFNMLDCKPTATPVALGTEFKRPEEKVNIEFPYRQAIGSLIYLMTGTRPDISWTVSKLSQFLENYDESHVTATKRVLRYIKNTIMYSLLFSRNTDSQLTGYCDADWAGDINDRRSTTGYVFKLGNGGAPISWNTKKQTTVALSTCESEYMSLCEATKELLYLRAFVLALNIPQIEKNIVYSDNQGAISLTVPGKMQHKRTKHIDVRYHFVKEQKDIEYKYIHTKENLADILTKPLGKEAHAYLVEKLPMERGC